MKNPKKSVQKNYNIVSPDSFVDTSLFASSSKINKSKNNSLPKHITSEPKIKETHILRTPFFSLRRDPINAERGYEPLILSKPDVQRLDSEKVEICDDITVISKCLQDKLSSIDEMAKCRKGWQEIQNKKDCKEGGIDLACQQQHQLNLLKENYCGDKFKREEEIKMMQTLLNQSENVAVWDKQVKEKKIATKVWEQEDWRLDEKMEKLRREELVAEEVEKANKKMDWMKHLVKQINQNKLKNLEEEELKYMEGRRLRHCWIKQNEEDSENAKVGGVERKEYRQELDKCMMDKTLNKMKEIELERRMSERLKAVRLELEKMSQSIKDNKSDTIKGQQKVSAMLCARQEELERRKLAAEEMRVMKAVNQLEKDKNTQDLIESSLRKEGELKIRKGRERQLMMKREAEALQAAKDRIFFESDLRKLIHENEKDNGVEGERWKRREYGALLRQQMCQQEKRQKDLICSKYKARVCMLEEEKHRNKLVEEHLAKELSKYKCELTPHQLLRISSKVKYMLENPP